MIRPVALAAAFALALALAAGSAAGAVPPPKVGISDYAQLKTPLPYPYDEKANAEADLRRAIRRAKATHRRVLVDMGGNWCGDCRILSATMDRPEFKAFLDKHFVVVLVDVGEFDKNLQIPARYGVRDKLEGVPAIFVIDPVNGRQLVSRDQVAALEDARHLQPQALADWIAKYAR